MLRVAGTVGFPYIVPCSVLGGDGEVVPSDRITLGLIGTGNINGHVEKPLTHTIAEGRRVVEVAARYGRILQTGLQRRSGGVSAMRASWYATVESGN